jgi:formate C-acetyltransferase
MNERIRNLRQYSLDIKPFISAERAALMTEFYKSDVIGRVTPPVERALAFKYLMEKKELYVHPGELIVAERGPSPKASPTYPEICAHSLDDLSILDTREKISYSVDDNVRAIYKDEIIPFWRGRSIRDRLFEELPQKWIAAYNAGVFTEFQEQRAPGHTANGDKIYKKGFLDLKGEIRQHIKRLDFLNDLTAFSKKQQLTAMDVAADALILYAQRHAEKLDELAANESDHDRKLELEQMAHICRRVPAHAPETFWEALQYYWFVHVGVITEYNTWDSFNPGRLDQHLYPFYKKEIDAGTLTPQRAKELLQAFWIKFNNQPAPPKVGVTAQESNTYTDFTLINVGGVTEDGSDAVNELSYLILEVIEEMRILQPSSMVQLSKKNPDRFLKRALKIIKTGFGQPSIFNTDAIVQELVRQGKSIVDARNGGASGCVEAGSFGKEAYFLTGYFNIPKVLEITLNNGKDPASGKMIGATTGDPADFDDFQEFMAALEKQINHFIDIKVEGNNIIERFYAESMPAPFLSLLIDDCIAEGVDYNAGGARYNTSYIQGVGLGTITDCLSAVKYNVFEVKRVSMKQMLQALADDFTGHEELRDQLLNDTPKYGNDDDFADSLTREIFEIYFKAVDGRPNTRGGYHRINLLPTTVHVYFGSRIGALPNGRKALEPLSEGISPSQGADRNGPTSVVKSAAKIDHIRTGGTLLNQKFTPQLLNDDVGIARLANLVRSYFRMDGHHIQFNVVSAEILRKAQKEPEKYRDLIVRVAGYSDYFVDLGPQLQEEIIRRTEHRDF